MQEIQSAPMGQEESKVVSVGEWLLMTLVAGLPLIGIIMLFVWAFGSGQNPNKSNYAKAMLIWIAVAIVLGIIFFATIGAAIFSSLPHSSV